MVVQRSRRWLEQQAKRQHEWVKHCDRDMRNRKSYRSALGCATSMMRRACDNVEKLIERLKSTGYQFAMPAEYSHIAAPPDVEERIDALVESGVHIPASLQAWLTEVGEVDLMGTHPEWNGTGLYTDDIPEGQEVWFTDPLVVGGIDHIESECRGIREEYPGEVISSVPIAPDMIHKAGLSGSGYEVYCTANRADEFVSGEYHCVSFTAYIRLAFHWSGFPGFDVIYDAPLDYLREIGKDLDPF